MININTKQEIIRRYLL